MFEMFPILSFFPPAPHPPELNPTIGLQWLYDNELDLFTVHPTPT